MPADWRGQLLTFSTTIDVNQAINNPVWTNARPGSTPLKIASQLGYPNLARTIADMNGIRSTTTKFKKTTRIKIPGVSSSDSFSVLCDDIAPQVTDGYAMFEVITRYGRTGMNKFDGYNPIALILSVQFEAFVPQDGKVVEQNIAILERMAGRGQYSGSGSTPPPIIRISATNAQGKTVPLIPLNYQYSPSNPSAPLFRVTQLAWDNTAPDQNQGIGVLRDNNGNRIRQKCAITVTEWTPVTIATTTSVANRAKQAAAKT